MQIESRQSVGRRPIAGPARLTTWPIQAVTGILLIVILLLHMYFHHFQEGLLSAAAVVLHVANPVIFILEILFVIFVTYHAMLGVRAIIFDLSSSEATRRKVTVALTIIGVITAVYGVFLAWLIRSQALVQ